MHKLLKYSYDSEYLASGEGSVVSCTRAGNTLSSTSLEQCRNLPAPNLSNDALMKHDIERFTATLRWLQNTKTHKINNVICLS